MSDPKSSYGEPVEEPTEVDDVVGRAQEGLADAEAARRDVNDQPVAYEPVEPEIVVERETVETDDAPSAANEWAAEPPSWANDPAAQTPEASEPAVSAPAASEPAVEPAPVVYAEPVTPYEAPVATSEPVDEQAAATTAFAPQPIFVQAPEAPRPRGNRAAAGAIGLLAALCFALLYLGTSIGISALAGDITADNAGTVVLGLLGTWGLWVPTFVFFVAFWLLGAIINRGRWGIWVIVGILVGVASYGGHLLGQLFEAPFWSLTASAGAELVESQLLAPLAIAAFVFGRELTIWFGAWVSARGKRVTELNAEAQREYERTLEAGPQLVRQ